MTFVGEYLSESRPPARLPTHIPTPARIIIKVMAEDGNPATSVIIGLT